MLSYLEIVEKAKHSCDETEVINLIEEYKLEREQLLTEHLKSKQVSDFHVFSDISASHSDMGEKTINCIVLYQLSVYTIPADKERNL